MHITTKLDFEFMRLVEIVTSRQLRALPLERGDKIGRGRYLFRKGYFGFSRE